MLPNIKERKGIAVGVIGTVLILLLPSAAFATNDNDNYSNNSDGSSTFKVNVYGSGINADTGELLTEVILERGAIESDTLIPGESGSVFLGEFVFDRGESDIGETFQACVTDQDSGLSNCNTGVNHEKNKPENIVVQVQDDNGLSDTSYQESDSQYGQSDRSFELEQDHEFDNEQNAQCNIHGDNNRCEIDQDNSFSDTLKDVGNAVGKLFNNYD